MHNSLFRIETLTGQPINMKDTQVRVRSQVIQFRLPFIPGGLIWNRPIAVLVRMADGQDQILLVPDVTRNVLLMLSVFSFAGIFLRRLFRPKND